MMNFCYIFAFVFNNLPALMYLAVAMQLILALSLFFLTTFHFLIFACAYLFRRSELGTSVFNNDGVLTLEKRYMFGVVFFQISCLWLRHLFHSTKSSCSPLLMASNN